MLFKKILVNLLFIAIYYTTYYLFGFEVVLVVAIGQMVALLFKKDYKPIRRKRSNSQRVYIKPNTKMKF